VWFAVNALSTFMAAGTLQMQAAVACVRPSFGQSGSGAAVVVHIFFGIATVPATLLSQWLSALQTSASASSPQIQAAEFFADPSVEAQYGCVVHLSEAAFPPTPELQCMPLAQMVWKASASSAHAQRLAFSDWPLREPHRLTWSHWLPEKAAARHQLSVEHKSPVSSTPQ
jgi:hypothetical protein